MKNENIIGEKVIIDMSTSESDLQIEGEIIGVDICQSAFMVVITTGENAGSIYGYNNWRNLKLKKYYNKRKNA